MTDLITEVIRRGGYLGIFLLMALENIFPPVPSEVIMGFGGVLVARGDMAFFPLLIIGTLGTVAGNLFWYWLGRRWNGGNSPGPARFSFAMVTGSFCCSVSRPSCVRLYRCPLALPEWGWSAFAC